MIGTLQSVLVEGFSKRSSAQVAGRTENNRVFNFSADEELIGKFVDVRITRAMPNSLQAEFLSISENLTGQTH